jgi:hypothetical protein
LACELVRLDIDAINTARSVGLSEAPITPKHGPPVMPRRAVNWLAIAQPE